MSQPDYARLRAGLASHRDERLRAHLLARHRMSAAELHAAEDEVLRRRDAGERSLLEELLVEQGRIDETDVARAFATEELTPTEGPRYEIGERLGEGATAVVYRARDRMLGRFVAIKVYKSTASSTAVDDPAALEGAALAQLRHANLVTVLDAGTLDGHPFLATEWVDGTTFAELLATRRHALRDLVALLADAADGLAEVHRHGLVHRDVKPENVLVDAQGRAKVCDFGFALATRADGDVARGPRSAGTPHFMAPEQWRPGECAIGPAADVYGLGALLYQVLVGAPPFAGVDGDDLARAVLDDDPPEPHRLVRVNRDLSAIATKALARAPQHRYPDAGRFAEELHAWLAGLPVKARTMPWPLRLARAARRQPLRAAALVGGVSALTLALGVWFLVAERRALREDLERRMKATSELGLDAAIRLRRAGDTAGLAQLGEVVAAACDDVLREFEDEAGPHYVLGRMARAQMRFSEALEHQERAARLAPADPRVHFELGMLRLQAAFGELRQRRAAELRDGLWRGAVGWARARQESYAPDPERLDDRLVAAAIDDLRLAGTPFAVALAAALELRDGASFTLPDELAAQTDEEEVFSWLAVAAARRSDHAAAIRWTSEGHARDRGYAPHLVLRASSREAQWEANGERTASAVDATFTAIAADLDAVIGMTPSTAELSERCALVFLLLGGEARRLHATCADSCFQRAIAGLERAIVLAPDRVELRHGLATAHLDRAGLSGRAAAAVAVDLAAAEQELARAMAIDPDRPGLFESLGHVRLAQLKRARGVAERIPAYQLALDAFTGAAARAPDHFGPHLGAAQSHLLAGKRDAAINELEATLARYPRARSIVEPMLARLRR
ncbi:MAG: serine/threonine protein kinase [Planctomycetes bacterium]|nr:serine/threonine protein kinase [Planctomycetota bacterium]